MRGYIFTCYADGSKIDDSAKFKRASSVSEMLERMQEGFKDCKVVDCEPGDFGDCFAKFVDEPTQDTLEFLAEEYGVPVEVLTVRAPGTHPGGKQWWVDVIETVYVPVFETENA